MTARVQYVADPLAVADEMRRQLTALGIASFFAAEPPQFGGIEISTMARGSVLFLPLKRAPWVICLN